MKVYNIRDSRKFFERLAVCSGTVELISEDGTSLALLSPAQSPLYYMDGEIRQMELRFSNGEDCRRIANYLIAC